ncbi:hypothetical protein Acor_58970 [Acrocarpospora corrugata]|uniref:PucR family transcriptional regulator n=1 Tax=Acrocarpospora corrugata TaxID=35763 RepID=A0A5M3W9V8_9ACTN|nr:PucR family transcriptional regulator [Acrocarpospora corrugata]GES03831.1 hypothetical protein Acor_58970 [Acrocarpospora corrugata]
MLIRDLLALDELRLILLTGETQAEITGALITDLPDPARYLAGGELVLTGMMWRQDPADSRRFVDILVRGRVSALAAGDARLGHIPADLLDACRERGLPLIEVPIEVSFGAVTEAVTRRLAGAQAGDLRRALGRHRRIVAAVAEGAGLTELCELMSAELGVAGAVISAAGTIIAGSLPVADAGRLAREFLGAVRLPLVTAGPYTIFAVDRAHRAAGWALVCGGDLDPEIGYELASCVALARTRMEGGRRVERRLAEQLIALATAGTADRSELSARLRTCGIDAGEPYAVVSASVREQGVDPAVLGGQVVEELMDRRVVAAAAADGAIALVPLREGTADEVAAMLKARVAALPGVAVAIGVSAALTGSAAVRGGVEEAGHARRMAEARGGGVVTSAEIYTHALLLATVPGDVRRSFSERLLAPLFAYDRKHQADLVRTLGTFLDCAGSWNTCAEHLHVHVNTVRYRIRRVEELTGKDLSAMADRVDLYLALRAS